MVFFIKRHNFICVHGNFSDVHIRHHTDMEYIFIALFIALLYRTTLLCILSGIINEYGE